MKTEVLAEQAKAAKAVRALMVNNRQVHLDYLKHLKESVETLREIVEEAKATTPLTRKKQVTFVDQCVTSNNNTHKHVEQQTTQKTYVPMIPSTGVNSCTDASGSKSRSNTKKNRISPATSVNSCSKHITRDHSRLRNFVKKFIGTVRFKNDHFGSIMGKNSCYVRDTNGVELIKVSCGSNLYTISVEDMMKFSPICLLSKASKTKSWSWHRRLNHLNFGTNNDLARKDLVR
nr:integrase, catalytic region, zinc finger, CCHC-type, peptidase aspartic, catalytic [Tanacetum cinerariifolium]